jgi:hypothetical protein
MLSNHPSRVQCISGKGSQEKDFIPYGFKIVIILSRIQGKKEGPHLEYRFQTGRFRRHIPKGVVLQHVEQVSYRWPYHS